MNQDQHVKVHIAVDGAEKVSFRTQFGWVESTSITIDCTDLAEARKSATDFLKELECAPFENCAGNEEFVDEGTDAVEGLIDMIADLDAMPDEGNIEWEVSYPINLTVKFDNSYVVSFG